MEKKVRKYPEIGQYRNAIQAITNTVRYSGKDENGDPIYNNDPLPTIRYRFTAKGHGTNGGLLWTYNGEEYEFHIQSREREITPMSDNMGFATYIHRIGEAYLYDKLVLPILLRATDLDYNRQRTIDGGYNIISHPDVQIYGEWSGKGIQNKVGIAEMDRFFMIFGIKVNGIWVTDEILRYTKLESKRIFNVCDLPYKEIYIDFNNPKQYTEMFDKWVKEIEEECPIAKTFGGLEKTIGEGWVGKPADPRWHHGRFFFKIKGTRHVGTGKDKKKKIKVDVEKVNSMQALVDTIVTNERLEQGITKLTEKGVEILTKSTGIYLKWLYDDVVKEELDTIISNGFEVKDISKMISNKGRKWYFNYLDKLSGL